MRPHGLQPTRLLCPWIFQVRALEWGAIAFSATKHIDSINTLNTHTLGHLFVTGVTAPLRV